MDGQVGDREVGVHGQSLDVPAVSPQKKLAEEEDKGKEVAEQEGEVPTAKKNQSSDASPLYINAEGVPNMSAGQARVYDRVKAR